MWAPGLAVQVDPIKPTLKPPGTKRLKLNYDEPLSTPAFKFNLRCYKLVCCELCAGRMAKCPLCRRRGGWMRVYKAGG